MCSYKLTLAQETISVMLVWNTTDSATVETASREARWMTASAPTLARVIRRKLVVAVVLSTSIWILPSILQTTPPPQTTYHRVVTVKEQMVVPLTLNRHNSMLLL